MLYQEAFRVARTWLGKHMPSQRHAFATKCLRNGMPWQRRVLESPSIPPSFWGYGTPRKPRTPPLGGVREPPITPIQGQSWVLVPLPLHSRKICLYVPTNYANLKFRVGVREKLRMSAKVTKCAPAARIPSLTSHSTPQCTLR